ncbi:sulfotransferase family protein [Methylotuvimicrobium buryatense]|uniref:Sulfotransferase family protein n=1 Tax=Methylotuvimicrobium buryatense TaxID=95641 RepID=A0A4P9UR99_METBY|nr:hypothetical protein [Methylotuvimicrobium buryatense]QCW84004.1 hypothetical protein EQU24_18470 [Methylotuvimicrobium buryatense]
MNNQTKTLLLVLGMHRSGTSAVTRGLMALGVDLGNQLMPPNFANPKGYFEDVDFVDINDQLLKSIKANYFSQSLIHQLDPLSIDAAMTTEAENLLNSKIAPNSILAIKDPRLCRLLWFWIPLFEKMDVCVKVVITSRNPLSIAQSLFARDGLDTKESLLLWHQHLIAAVNATHRFPRVFVDYDLLMANPKIQLQRIAQQLALTSPANIEQGIETYITDFLSDNLRHTQYSVTEFEQSDDVTADYRETYRLLNAACRDESSNNDQTFTRAWQDLNQRLYNLQPALHVIDQFKQNTRSTYPPDTLNAQIFVKQKTTSGEELDISEATSSRTHYLLNGKVQRIRALIPNTYQLLTLRLDISNAPCVILLHKLDIYLADGKLLWSWQHDSEIFTEKAEVTVLPDHANQQGCTVICWGHDPRFKLNLAQNLLAQVIPESFLDITLTPINLLEYMATQGPSLGSLLEIAASKMDGQLSKDVSTTASFYGTSLARMANQSAALEEIAILLNETLQNRDRKLKQLQQQLSEQDNRQQQLAQQLIRAEAQIELLKDLLI